MGRKGVSLVSILVAFTLSSILMFALVKFVKNSSQHIAQLNHMGAKEDLRAYLKQMIDCQTLFAEYGPCVNGTPVIIKAANGNVIVPQNPTPAVPFKIKATCDTNPLSISRFLIQVVPAKKTSVVPLPWEGLFVQEPPC